MAQEINHPVHHVTAPADRIPFHQKAVYGIGSFVNQFQAAAIGQLITVLNVGLGVNPALVGWIGAIPRFVDAFSDPLIGYSSDNTRTKYGRRRPWIFWGAIASGILLALMFQLYKGHNEMFYFGYVLAIQLLFVIAFACYSIPWIALGYEMTPDYHERTRLQAFASFFAQPVWMIAPWFFSVMSNKSYFPDIVAGARALAIVVGVLILVGGILPAIFNKEIYANLPKPEKVKGYANVIKDLWRNCADSFKCRPFVKLCAVTFLIFNGFMLASSFTFYVICFYVYGGVQPQGTTSAMDVMWHSGGTLIGLFGTLSSVCAFGAISITAWISSKIGKRKAFLLTMSLAVIGYALKWIGYDPQHPYLLLIAAPFLAFHLGSLFTIVPSMVADVCDYDELQCGTRREGMFSGIYWWIQKLGMAGASVLGGYLLNWTGFNIALGVGQSSQALLYMRLYDIGIPILTTLIAIYIIATFEVSEDKAYEIRKQLEAKRAKA
ncbi:MAG: MFS transporter [Candidatus Omnitrophica bacterium]|nr:MFS transporter [Candidatus Omnitrophota bacterium]